MSFSPLNRFIDAQERDYQTALAEIKNGKKRSHWMWYIFPQISGLGRSEAAKHYAIKDRQEAIEFLNNPILSNRLFEICEALVELEQDDPHVIFGSPDDMKLRSSMTLFAAVSGSSSVFKKVIDKYFDGIEDSETIRITELS
ncbi:DUF1810 domain-containing protein [Pedobacter duraquae]|uniref:Uncharacterized protein (DUF1810 family) n=1 Tax=Pedobacter duraquae TaxID=425511 RepID=A0A4R6IG46_9SPHI|nr:DUF1810 domain-containing protein [Pedobacter duraquae]TDO20731.1 uncharacterized protein (DUF1810 family) [Pedobacter duraquae]